MNRKLLFVSVVVTLFLSNLHNAGRAQSAGYIPKKGFVPDEKTAIAIAEAILKPIYGDRKIESEKPFHAALNTDGVWTVTGSLPKGWDGGVATIKIQRNDGRVVYVMHGK